MVRYRLTDVLAHEDRMLTGGQVPQRAEQVMRKAASVLDMVARWKMRPEALVIVSTTRDDLMDQLAKPKTGEDA
jgi:hypothetical protein